MKKETCNKESVLQNEIFLNKQEVIHKRHENEYEEWKKHTLIVKKNATLLMNILYKLQIEWSKNKTKFKTNRNWN